METRQIQYIGRKAEKPDNVTHSGLVWRGHGDTLTVDKVRATRLLMHPDIWRDVTDEMVDGEAPTTTETLNPEVPVLQGGRAEQIVTAIHTMDETNPEHFDENGYPNIAVVEGLLQYEIDPDELGLVFQDIRKLRDEEMGLTNGENTG
jgi:hypothetical protein